jgi:hypothetical protein
MPHREFGEALGASQRTANRWASGRSDVADSQLRTLARLVHPQDPGLAAEIAAAVHETPESLGLVAPAPLPPPPRPDPDPLTEAVVCAVADELSAVPSVVRRGLLVAFRRARELGLTLDEVERSIEARLKKATTTRKSSTSGD